MFKKTSNDNLDDLVHLSFFADIGTAITSAHDLKEILSQVMDKVGTIFAPMNWSLLLADTATNELVFKVAVGEAGHLLQNKRIPADEGLSGWIYRTGQPVIIADVKKDPRFSNKLDEITGFKTNSIIGVPLKTDEKTIGVIELVNKLNGEPFTQLELKLLSTIADFAAIAIERSFYIKALKRISNTDYLTGVFNRRYFDHLLNLETERCKRHSMILSVFLIDINNFKHINDTFGHSTGDRVLKNCAEILLKCVRRIDSVARYGGDEFAVLMPNTRKEQAEVVRKRILKGIEERNKSLSDIPFDITIGLHSAGPEGLWDIINESDFDLYRQKERKEPVQIEEYLLDYLIDEEREAPKKPQM